MLLPIEKMGLIKKEANSRDARVSYVKLSPAGKRILNEAIATAEASTNQILTNVKTKKIEDLSKLLLELGGTIS